MKIFLVFALVVSLYAKDRPTIGLVLSGGGARGGAHVGMIKMFEKHHIPIDYIVGTSMGAYVGGLYAGGVKIDDIEKMLVETDWSKAITVAYPREDIPMREKQISKNMPGHLGVGINQDYDIVLPKGIFSAQNMLTEISNYTHTIDSNINFDDLTIPFRSVSTNIDDGKQYIWRKGPLHYAIYSSLAIPGGFDPLRYKGMTLVDGGTTENLPVSVMRKEFNPDIIIAVDITTPFTADIQVKSYLQILAQLTDILTQNNVQRTIYTLKPNEILVSPNLDGYNSLDSDKYAEIIKIGEESFDENYDEKLKQFVISDEEYAKYVKSIKNIEYIKHPIIDKIIIDNQTYLDDKIIKSRLKIKVGDTLDYDKLKKDIYHLYNFMIFDRISYHVSKDNGKNVLNIVLTPAWNVHGGVQFFFGLSDDFKGNSDYQAIVQYRALGLNSYGGETLVQAAIGKNRFAKFEYYQPFEETKTFYFRPEIFHSFKKEQFTANSIGVGTSLTDSYSIFSESYGGTLSLGADYERVYRLETGYTLKSVNLDTSLLVVTTDVSNPIQSIHVSEAKVSSSIYVKALYDNLDHTYFPTHGNDAKFVLKKELKYLGSDYNFYNIEAQYRGAFSFDSHTIMPYVKYATTSNHKDFEPISQYTLGGFHNLSGMPTNAYIGENLAFVMLEYRYALRKDELFGVLSVPMYIGGTIESGQVWSKAIIPVSMENLSFGSSLYLAADTMFGPFYLAFGAASDHNYAGYIYLGNKF